MIVSRRGLLRKNLQGICRRLQMQMVVLSRWGSKMRAKLLAWNYEMEQKTTFVKRLQRIWNMYQNTMLRYSHIFMIRRDI